jgi:2-dehydro-3-deoxy-L-fuconate 4-dehydrogenase
MGRLAGKTAIVTAAAAGIGRASALSLAREGAKVFAADIDEKGLATLKNESKAIEMIVLDVTDAGKVSATPDRTGPVDVLVNCSGFVHHGTIMEVGETDWDFSFDLNVRAHFRMIRAYLPAMLDRGGGSIINIASVVSTIKGAPNRFLYGATKGAVIALTKQLAADYVSRGIRANAVCPGTVETPSLLARMRARGDYDKARAEFLARQPTGRLGQPEEIAALVAYLASDEAIFVTGQAFIIDGGWTI